MDRYKHNASIQRTQQRTKRSPTPTDTETLGDPEGKPVHNGTGMVVVVCPPSPSVVFKCGGKWSNEKAGRAWFLVQQQTSWHWSFGPIRSCNWETFYKIFVVNEMWCWLLISSVSCLIFRRQPPKQQPAPCQWILFIHSSIHPLTWYETTVQPPAWLQVSDRCPFTV